MRKWDLENLLAAISPRTLDYFTYEVLTGAAGGIAESRLSTSLLSFKRQKPHGNYMPLLREYGLLHAMATSLHDSHAAEMLVRFEEGLEMMSLEKSPDFFRADLQTTILNDYEVWYHCFKMLTGPPFFLEGLYDHTVGDTVDFESTSEWEYALSQLHSRYSDIVDRTDFEVDR